MLKVIEEHIAELRACALCSGMEKPVVTGMPVRSEVLLIGQAPGGKEGVLGRPFAWTAGKTLFRWFSEIGIAEEDFRSRVYMAAVCRCFPGKNPKGGDRVPSETEIKNCSRWLEREIEILQPELLIPVGKLAIRQFLDVDKLELAVGMVHRLKIGGKMRDVIPLPHPSGASTWHRMEPGKTLLKRALRLIAAHPAYARLIPTTHAGTKGMEKKGKETLLPPPRSRKKH